MMLLSRTGTACGRLARAGRLCPAARAMRAAGIGLNFRPRRAQPLVAAPAIFSPRAACAAQRPVLHGWPGRCAWRRRPLARRAPLLLAPRSVKSKSSSSSSSLALWLALAALVVVFDQFTKWLIVGSYRLGDAQPVTGFFNIVRAHNTGAAFSFLAGAGGWQRWFFTALAVAVAAFIIWLLRAQRQQRLYAFSLSMILGGAIGNVIDRVVHGYVVDFLDFHWAFLRPLFHGGHFPAFNVADMAITAGAAGLILHEIARARHGQ